MHFSRQLAVFVRGGIPLLEALDAITEETGNKFFKKVLTEVATDIREGETFSASMAKHSAAFPPYYIGILRAAELTGNLDEALVRLSEYIERDLEARRKITSALAYPMVVLVAAIGVVGMLVGFVLPRFEKFFKSFDAKLPVATRILLDVSHFMRTRWYIFAAVILLIVALILWAQRNDRARYARDKMLLRVPAVGDVIRHAVLERFCRILAAMTNSGVPLTDSLSITSIAVSNSVYKRGIEEARQGVMRGEGLAAPLAATGLFPSAARQIFRVGEETGNLDDQLEIAANFYDKELDHKIKRLTTIFEPTVIVLMGAIVGFVAIALVSAMYGIFHQVKV